MHQLGPYTFFFVTPHLHFVTSYKIVPNFSALFSQQTLPAASGYESYLIVLNSFCSRQAENLAFKYSNTTGYIPSLPLTKVIPFRLETPQYTKCNDNAWPAKVCDLLNIAARKP